MIDKAGRTYSFAEFEVDAGKRLLFKNAQTISLNSKAFDLLLVLIEKRGQVVAKEDLLEAVWTNQFVEENNLTVHISALRKIFGEKKGEHQFIVTVPGKGYKFVAEISQPNVEIVIENHKIERITVTEDAEKPVRLLGGKSSNRRIFYALAGLIFVAAGVFFAFRYFAAAPTTINSIAVLPFINEDANTEYLSDGLAESVIYSLSQVPNLKVLSRNSVFRYKGKTTDAKTIGNELKVQAVLVGRVNQRGDALDISAELISTADNSVIWGERFTRNMSDVEKLQNDIAASISSKLRFKFSGVKLSGAQNAEAYRLYLKGRFQWNKRNAESLIQAVEFYKQAIELDPQYALAFAGLAETYVLYSSYDIASAKDSMPQAKAAALKALELDEHLAEAHTALASYLNYYEWDRVGAEREYRRAIAINPNYATARHWLGADCLALVKRFDEALAELKIAEELDPLSPIIGKDIGSTLSFAGRNEEAIKQHKRVLVFDPSFAVAHGNLGLSYLRQGKYEESIAPAQKALELSYDPIGTAFLALSFAKLGKRDEAGKLLNELLAKSRESYVPEYALAVAYLAVGEKEKAYVALEKQVEERGYWASLYGVMPELDELRSEPRFKAMLKRMNLPE